METQVPNRYHSSQEALYTAGEIIWDAVLERLEDFHTHKPKYTEEYVAGKKAAITAARNLGTSQARAAGSEMAHVPLQDLAEDCLTMHVTLDSYIDDAFSPADKKAAHEAAGSAYYLKASNNNWLSLRNLNSASLLFITSNTGTLSMNGQNMPDKFPQAYTSKVKAFDDQYMLFIKKEGKNPAGTAGKITANNAIYSDIISVGTDANAIWRRNDLIKSEYTFDDVLRRITGDKKTGIRIQAIEALSELPVAGLSVIARPGDRSATTPEDGITELALPEGTYKLFIQVPAGYLPVPEQSVTTNAGIMHRKKLILQKASA